MLFFQPYVSLSWTPATKSYLLQSRTLVPSGHFTAGRAQDGVLPDGIVLIPEALSVVLEINYFHGHATHAPQIISHNLPLTRLNESHQFITVFNALQGAVVGAASIGVPNRGAEFSLAPPGTSLTATTFPAPQAGAAVRGPLDLSWAAWIISMPWSPRYVFVMGFVTVPNPGIKPTLRRAVPQGINPAILILELVFEQLPGFWPQVLATKPVQYVELPYSDAHTDCTVRWPSGASITFPIIEIP